VPVFERTVIMSKVACRFCQVKFDYKNRKRREPYTQEDKAKFTMPVGTRALRMITSGGPTATAYVCDDCARDVMKNITEEIAK